MERADPPRRPRSAPPRGIDGLRLTAVPFVPEIRLHLAEDPIVFWARMEAEAGTALTPPFWASAWPGGQVLARYLLDHPQVSAGRQVLDLAAGSGLVAIAAALTGARSVTANDIDPYALAAVILNARCNAVPVAVRGGDLLDGDADGADLVLAGDVFYSAAMAERMLAFLDRVVRRGGQVLVGDPGRTNLPRGRLSTVASYPLPEADAFADSQIRRADVLRPALAPGRAAARRSSQGGPG
ncbi:50S ribosomal protein L11 methyltransferase [Solwaraspora sp. WMMD1047]|uniref:class I SAM-dependent methyltransferase n=1 Tax=Solwaraspora sp. WMMD1047 TaxID=3016102 RepID=UPI0024173EC1|nr:50S ribosomal protein L11 methyltransferase [Solwaraspora sp. WMMD1047]MDG4831943.1 50S ribosomal protein L11 methyltransferase [Solwaraspora sp. WMMD1047]